MTAVIKVSDLHVKLDSAHILRGIDLEVSNGEVIAILGPNGSGKSTLIKTIVSNVDYSSGSLQLFGTELHNRR
ncbi:MAG: ATP-binding cassette domain-containing protein, partial [Arcanobacterium sp.]|nr:ATP-binding cassette domain-containing protein [Arcanobacterium sp.]